MKVFSLLVLGANSAVPQPGRFPTSFVLQYEKHRFLLDCGEGSQIKMSEFHVKRSRIDHIFITHLHGDHIFGLPGMLNSYNLNRRDAPLHLIGPQGLREYVELIIKTTGAAINFDLVFHELAEAKRYDLGICHGLQVTAFPLSHRILTFGYRFDECVVPLNIIPEAIDTYNLTVEEIKTLKAGLSVKRGTATLPSEKLVYAPYDKRSFAFCTDTLYDPSIIRHIHKVNCLYHEATYLELLAEKARERMHATARQAAQIAKEAEAGHLIIGHYSSRYKDLTQLLQEAQMEFPNTSLASEGNVYPIT